MNTWERNINTVSKTTEKYLQESYAAVLLVIQSEWIFLQHITKKYRRPVCKIGEYASGKLFASPILQEVKNSLTHRRISRYHSGQESRPGPPGTLGVREWEVPKISTCKHRVNLIPWQGKAHFSTLITFWRSGKKGMKDRKIRITSMTQNTRN